MPMQLDPSIILNSDHDRIVVANRELDQRRREGDARIAVDQQEAELRKQEILARREEIIQRALERNQPKEWDPGKANQALTYQQNVGKAVYKQLVAAKEQPESWGLIRADIGRLAGPDAIADLPEAWDDQTSALVDSHIASYKAYADQAQAKEPAPQMIEVPDPNDPTKTIRQVVGLKVGDSYPTVPKTATSAANPTAASLAVAAAGGDEQAKAALKILKSQQASSGGGAGAPMAATGGLDEGGLEFAAAKHRITGTLPARDSKQNAAIINAAAKQAKDLGQSPVVAIQKQAAYKGDAAALAQMQKMSASAEAFENKALAQTSIIRELSKKVPRTSMPLINSALQAGRTEITGDANATMLANAIETFSEEYAKIMNGATGSSAAASDSSRAAAKRLINTAMSAGTMDKVLDLMQREMDLTMTGYDVTKQHISERMLGAGAAPPPAAPPAGARPDPLGIR
jgi:hypothetical protein